MLSVVLGKIFSHYYSNCQPYLALLYTTLISTMYHGLLRVGEAASGTHPVLAHDVHIGENKKKFLLILRTSKTHWKNVKPQEIKISAAPTTKKNPAVCDDEVTCKLPCPYELLKSYSEVRGDYETDIEPFFVFSDRSPVTPQHVNKCLKRAIKKAGYDSRLYSSHSLRGGRSCDLYRLGLSINKIMKLGRWKSNTVYKYIRQ